MLQDWRHGEEPPSFGIVLGGIYLIVMMLTLIPDLRVCKELSCQYNDVLQGMSTAALFGIACIASVFVALLAYVLHQPMHPDIVHSYPKSYTSIFVAFNLCFYAFEGQNCVSEVIMLPEGISAPLQVLIVENAIKHSREMTHNCGALFVTSALCFIFGVAIGFYSAVVFGEETQNPVTLNLPQ